MDSEVRHAVVVCRPAPRSVMLERRAAGRAIDWKAALHDPDVSTPYPSESQGVIPPNTYVTGP